MLHVEIYAHDMFNLISFSFIRTFTLAQINWKPQKFMVIYEEGFPDC